VSILRDRVASKTNGILKRFVDARGKLPKRIVVYRDGVSEGQYQMVVL
jgi:hypothetical protein